MWLRAATLVLWPHWVWLYNWVWLRATTLVLLPHRVSRAATHVLWPDWVAAPQEEPPHRAAGPDRVGDHRLEDHLLFLRLHRTGRWRRLPAGQLRRLRVFPGRHPQRHLDRCALPRRRLALVAHHSRAASAQPVGQSRRWADDPRAGGGPRVGGHRWPGQRARQRSRVSCQARLSEQTAGGAGGAGGGGHFNKPETQLKTLQKEPTVTSRGGRWGSGGEGPKTERQRVSTDSCCGTLVLSVARQMASSMC